MATLLAPVSLNNMLEAKTISLQYAPWKNVFFEENSESK